MDMTQALILRSAHSAYVQRLARTSKAQLIAIYRDELSQRNRYMLHGGPATKDELINAITELRYPQAKLNESIHVLYHEEGYVNEICAYCNPNPCPKCGALDTCDYESGLGAVVNGRHL